MMSGMALIWLIFIIVMVARSKGSRPAGRAWSSPLPPDRQQSPDEIARERYARGELDWPEYQEMLVNLLKDRYVRGDLELDDYEQRASLVLDGIRPVRDEASARLSAPTPAGELRPERPEDGPRPVPGESAQSVGRTLQADAVPPAANEDASEAEHGREARAESALDALRRRFLTGELTYQEYEDQRKRLMAA